MWSIKCVSPCENRTPQPSHPERRLDSPDGQRSNLMDASCTGWFIWGRDLVGKEVMVTKTLQGKKIKSDLHLQLSLTQTAECESCILMRLWAQRRVALPPPPPLSSTLLRFCFFFLALGVQRRECAALHPALSRPCFSRGRGESRLLLHPRDV